MVHRQLLQVIQYCPKVVQFAYLYILLRFQIALKIIFARNTFGFIPIKKYRIE